MKPLTLIAVALTLIATLIACGGMGAGAAQRQSSSWGNLEWFELEIDPFLFRFSVIPGDSIMYSKNPRDKENGYTWVLPRDDPKAASVVKSLDDLIRAHRLMESPPNEPVKTFKDETVQTPSVHIRIGYGTDGQGGNKRWQSYYHSDNLPNNVKEFIEACQKLGDDYYRSAGGALPITPEEFRQHFPSSEKNAIVKITAKGELYVNDRQVSLEELDAELRRVKKVGGGVLFQEEPPEDGSREKAAAVASAVMRKIRELKLEMVHIK
ncbi:MAG: ExbD/TolR family protein [Pyrinomonadaceae bacterium]